MKTCLPNDFKMQGPVFDNSLNLKIDGHKQRERTGNFMDYSLSSGGVQ